MVWVGISLHFKDKHHLLPMKFEYIMTKLFLNTLAGTIGNYVIIWTMMLINIEHLTTNPVLRYFFPPSEMG